MGGKDTRIFIAAMLGISTCFIVTLLIVHGYENRYLAEIHSTYTTEDAFVVEVTKRKGGGNIVMLSDNSKVLVEKDKNGNMVEINRSNEKTQ